VEEDVRECICWLVSICPALGYAGTEQAASDEVIVSNHGGRAERAISS
jgi:hypothetical protein